MCVCVCVFQMSISTNDMASPAENISIIHLDAPILPDKADMSNMTIIRTANGSIIEDQFFLNSVIARGVSGVFVWTALLITCHQVSLPTPIPVPQMEPSSPQDRNKLLFP